MVSPVSPHSSSHFLVKRLEHALTLHRSLYRVFTTLSYTSLPIITVYLAFLTPCLELRDKMKSTSSRHPHRHGSPPQHCALDQHKSSCIEQRQNEVNKGQKKQKEIDIQQLKFAGGHPPNYYAAGRMLKYARADGMACFHSPMVVCAG